MFIMSDGRSTQFGPGLPNFATPAAMLRDMEARTAGDRQIRNYCGIIEDMAGDSIAVPTDLFPLDALTFYTRHNLAQLDPDHKAEDKALYEKFYNAARGGGQVR
jgi:hypothetical protein